MNADARVVVVGGGIGGVSTLYHLTRLGWSDVVLVEANELTSGSTWHAAGLCTQFIQSYNLMQLLRTSVELYGVLEEETGLPVDFHRCGSVRIGTTRDRLHQFEHVAGIAASVGVPFEIVSPERALELFPLARARRRPCCGVPPDRRARRPDEPDERACEGRPRRRRHHPSPHAGDRAQPRTRRLDGGDLAGSIRAEHVVIAAGQWSREVGRLAGVELPIVPLQHHYLVTEPMPEVESRAVELPVFRDPDNSFYARQEGSGLLIGPFERNPLTWALDGIPEGFHGQLLSPNLTQIEDCLVAAAERIPRFGEVGIKTVINGPDGYTPDGRCLMGPVPGQPGLHVLAGFSIFGIVFGGGAGKYAAEWIVDGQPSDNMWELDVRRFGEYARVDVVRRRARVRGVRGRVQDPFPRGGAAGRPPAQDRSAARPPRREGRRDGRAVGVGAPALVREGGARR